MPGIPHSIWGTVKYSNGEDVEDGAIVKAVVGDENYTTEVVNGTFGYYTPFRVEDPTGNNSRNNNIIYFYVDGAYTDQTLTFESGSTNFNLTVDISSNQNDNNNGNGGGQLPPVDKVEPVAKITAKSYGFVNKTVFFSGSESYDSDGEIISYSWNFGDGSTGSGIKVNTSFDQVGNYTVSLLVTDNEGYTDIDELNIKIMNDKDDDGWGDSEEEEYDTDPDNESDYPLDFDGDRIPDDIDKDDDNDGLSDALENSFNLNPKDDSDVLDISSLVSYGYLIDKNSDGIYDLFLDSSSEKTSNLSFQSEGIYLIDSNFDGNYDLKYNNDKISSINENSFNIIFVILILAIISVFIFLVWKFLIQKRRDKK